MMPPTIIRRHEVSSASELPSIEMAFSRRQGDVVLDAWTLSVSGSTSQEALTVLDEVIARLVALQERRAELDEQEHAEDRERVSSGGGVG